ncbi:hypothetical protein R6Q57_002082 [Mikania cordata]
MRSSRTNEKGKAPVCANILSPNTHPHRGITFLEESVDEDDFDSILDMPLSTAIWDDYHRSVAQGIPELIENPSVYSTSHFSLQNPQTKLSSNLGGKSSFGSFNRSQVRNDSTSSSSLFCPRDGAPVRTQNNHDGVQRKFEGGFLSLGLGGTSETVSRSQLNSREISDKLKETASDELKIARARKVTGQTSDDTSMGSQINNSGFSNQFSHVNRMASTNKGFEFHGSLNSGLGSSPHHILPMRQNDRWLDKAIKLKKAASTESKTVHSRKDTGHNLEAEFVGFQRNNSSFSNQFGNVDRMTSTNYEAGVHSTFNSGPSSSRKSILQMQKNKDRNVRSGDIDLYKGYQSAHSATLGGNSARSYKSQQHNLKPSKLVKPSRMTSSNIPFEQIRHLSSTSANVPNYAGEVTSHNDTPTQVLGGKRLSQRIAIPQVSWVGCGLAGTDSPFPKRLGVELSVRNSPQNPQGHLSHMGTSLQTASTGQICPFSDKRSSRMPHNALRTIGGSDGGLVSYPINHQEPFFTYGQSQNAVIQRPEGPQGVPSTNVLSSPSQSQKLDLHVRPHNKRTAVSPQSSYHWVQHKKRIIPALHHSMPKPPKPVTTGLIHPPTPVGSRAQPAGPIAADIRRVIPRTSNVRPRVHVASAPAVSHITWKDPDATFKLSGYKCSLCKKDVALTSEGPVFQPTVLPPVAILPCGHAFHDQCLQKITPEDQAKGPPCIPCAIGEN